MRIDKLFLLRFMRSYYRVTKRVDRDFYAVSFAIPVFAVFIDAAVRGVNFCFTVFNGVCAVELSLFTDFLNNFFNAGSISVAVFVFLEFCRLSHVSAALGYKFYYIVVNPVDIFADFV